MDVFNRIVTIVLFLVAILLLLVFIIAPVRLSNELAADFALLGEALEEYQIHFFSFSLNWILFVLLGGMALVVLVVLLYLEVRRPAQRRVRILRVSGGEALVGTETIAQRLEHGILQLGDISEVRPVIFPRRSGVDALLRVTTAPEVDIPAKTEEIFQVAREVLEEQMGLRVRNIQIRLGHGPYTFAPASIPPSAPPPLSAVAEGEAE
jgi:hypothetical protein